MPYAREAGDLLPSIGQQLEQLHRASRDVKKIGGRLALINENLPALHFACYGSRGQPGQVRIVDGAAHALMPHVAMRARVTWMGPHHNGPESCHTYVVLDAARLKPHEPYRSGSVFATWANAYHCNDLIGVKSTLGVSRYVR